MPVSRDDVLRVAALARLALSDDELSTLARELDEILGHVEALGQRSDYELRAASYELRAANYELRTANYELRTGGASDADSLSGDLGGIAPDFGDGFFRVPRLGSHTEPE